MSDPGSVYKYKLFYLKRQILPVHKLDYHSSTERMAYETQAFDI